MKTFLKYPLNLQLFADDGGTGGEGGNPGAQATPIVTPTTIEIDYSKVAEAVEKRSAQTGDNVLKGYLKSQGLTGVELDQAVASFKEQKAQAETLKSQESENVKLENQKLKDQIFNASVENKLTVLAAAEGVSVEKLPFLSKLINREGIADDKGEILEDKLKEAMNTVIKAFPEMKGTQQAGGFQQIGAPGSEGGVTADASVAAFQNGRIVLPKK